MDIKCKLKVILAKKEMQLSELAGKIGKQVAYLSDIQTGIRDNITLKNALLIARAVDCLIDEVWIDEDEDSSVRKKLRYYDVIEKAIAKGIGPGELEDIIDGIKK